MFKELFKSKKELNEEKKNIEEIHKLKTEITNLEQKKRVFDKNNVIKELINYQGELSKNIRLKQFPIRLEKLILLKKKSLLEKLKNSNLYNSNSATKYIKDFHPEINTKKQKSPVQFITTTQKSKIRGNTLNSANQSSVVENTENVFKNLNNSTLEIYRNLLINQISNEKIKIHYHVKNENKDTVNYIINQIIRSIKRTNKIYNILKSYNLKKGLTEDDIKIIKEYYFKKLYENLFPKKSI
jgi:hypothetical protein